MENAVFEDEEMNQEVKKMIACGLIDANWGEGLSRSEAKNKFQQILSYGPSSEHIEAEVFEDEDMNQEVRDMIACGLIDANWCEGLNQSEAKNKFQQILLDGPSSEHTGADVFEDEDLNQEVRDKIACGDIDANWSEGLSRSEAKNKFQQILLDGPSSEHIGAEQFENSANGIRKSSTPARGKNSSKLIYELFSLNPNDYTFKDILTDFEHNVPLEKVKAIQRVENEKQQKIFDDEIKQLKILNGNEFDLHIQDLYHGSNAPTDEICSYGLDQRMGTIGLFGRGIYFSDNVKKCVKYLKSNKDSAIYKCSVILGDIKEYPKGVANPKLKREPKKENGDFYHSVKGNMTGSNEYVIFENRRCLVKYRIVLGSTKDEDSDIKEIAAKKDENSFESWERHMHYMVKMCPHEDKDLDPETEKNIQNIEKVRLQLRYNKEVKSGKPLTPLTYKLLLEERKKWRSMNERMNPPKSDGASNQVITTQQHSTPDILREDLDVQLVADKTLSEFLEITKCEDIELAESILSNQNWNLDGAINEYFSIMP